ncbi:protein phosphatase 2C domain-containing protein [Bacillus timonensis]|nr:protein phosphatase 2C domain-containing protein [Bacillus timonensis]
MNIKPDNAQHIGARSKQEDSFGFSNINHLEMIDKRGILAILADGMGGMAFGQEASQSAVHSFLEYYQDLTINVDFPEILYQSLIYANKTVCQLALESGNANKIGSTLIAAAIKHDSLYWISVGDSRIYLYRNNEIHQLTQDHVYANILYEEVANGRMTKDEADQHPQREALTSYLGNEVLNEVDRNIIPFPLEIGDRILLCSDGMYGNISEAELIEILNQHCDGACQKIVNTVIDKGNHSQDNITVILLDRIAPQSEVTVRILEERERPTATIDSSFHLKKTRNYRTLVLLSLLFIFFFIFVTVGFYMFDLNGGTISEFKNIINENFNLLKGSKQEGGG